MEVIYDSFNFARFEFLTDVMVLDWYLVTISVTVAAEF
jgi:hypothetical protein